MCRKLLRWAKDVTFSPKKATKKDVKYGELMKRLAIISLIPGVLTTLASAVLFDSLVAAEGYTAAIASVAVGILIFLFAAVVAPFVNAAITHFFGKMVFGLMKKDFKKTYNAAAYAMVPRFLFVWIPVVGGVIAFIWGIVTMTYALANQQKISRARALLVIFIPVIIAVIILVAVGLSVFGSLGMMDMFQGIY